MKIQPENLKIDLYLNRLCDTEEKAEEIDNEIMEAVAKAAEEQWHPGADYREHTLFAVFEGSEVSVKKRCIHCGNRGHKTNLSYDLVVQSNADDGAFLHITEQDVALLKQTLSQMKGFTGCDLWAFAPVGSASDLPEADKEDPVKNTIGFNQ